MPHGIKVTDLFKELSRFNAGFVVVGDQERIHGIVTEGLMLQIFLKFQQHPEHQALISFRQYFEPVQFAQQEEDMGALLKKVLTAVGHRVVVLDQNQKAVGYLTAKNILPHFAGTTANEDNSKPNAGKWESDLYFYESFFEKAPFMMHSVNSEGHLQMANEMLHRVLGYQYPELIGRHLSELYTAENLKKAQKGVEVILKEGFHKIVHSAMLTKLGTPIEVEVASRALHDVRGNPIGTVTVSRPLDMKVLLGALKFS